MKSSVKNTDNMQSLINKGKIKMNLQDHAELSTNDMGTVPKIDVWLTRLDSRDVLS